MSETIIYLLDDVDRLAILCLSCSTEERQKYVVQINETVKELRRKASEQEKTVERLREMINKLEQGGL